VEELTRGAFSVAAPVRDATGAVTAAVSVIARAERRAEPQFGLGVRLAARGISAALGWGAHSADWKDGAGSSRTGAGSIPTYREGAG